VYGRGSSALLRQPGRAGVLPGLHRRPHSKASLEVFFSIITTTNPSCFIASAQLAEDETKLKMLKAGSVLVTKEVG
jgi:hypothetical protein